MSERASRGTPTIHSICSHSNGDGRGSSSSSSSSLRRRPLQLDLACLPSFTVSVSHGAAWFLGVNDDGAGGGDAASASSRQPATQSIKPNHMPMPPPVSQCCLKDEVRICQESILLAKVLKDSASPLLTKKTVSVV